MAGTISLLNINPSQLEFLFEADRELKSALNIRNVHDDIRTAFKIKVQPPLSAFAVDGMLLRDVPKLCCFDNLPRQMARMLFPSGLAVSRG